MIVFDIIGKINEYFTKKIYNPYFRGYAPIINRLRKRDHDG